MPWTSAGSSHWKMLIEINLSQQTLKFYTFWVHWNRREYQHSTGVFVKIVFNPFYSTGLFLYFLRYIRKQEVSRCFQGASAMKWVKSHLIFSRLFCYSFDPLMPGSHAFFIQQIWWSYCINAENNNQTQINNFCFTRVLF